MASSSSSQQAVQGNSVQGLAIGGIERISPKSGKKSYKPDVPLSVRPHLDMKFKSIDDGCSFYQRYAKAGGFTVRKSTETAPQGVITLKYYVCSKQGTKPYGKVDTVSGTRDPKCKEKYERQRPSIRTGCNARMTLKLCEDKSYKVFGFVEEHNHSLVDVSDYHLLTSARSLTYNQEDFIYSLSKLNIGPVKAFNIMRTHCGGFDQVGVTKTDCKNFKKKINLFIGKFDAEMVVRRLLRKKEYLPDFSCEYITDKDGKLCGLFWADGEMKRNYDVFGDDVAFDSTFRSNKYDMIFVPFTGIDNHHRNVTFGAALIASESAESYIWLLDAFKKSFGKEPRVVVTDQDAAMRVAIEKVFPTSRHRYCMWHIMKKLAVKVGNTLCKDKKFKKGLCEIVWNDTIDVEEFESKWNTIITEYNLEANKWLHDIYGLRANWIPAYYRNQPMSGLMRTTSRSESENYFFGKITNSGITLVEFLSNYETAIESQRFTHRKNDHDSRHTVPNWVTEYELEKQAYDIYTRNIFYDVQDEIYNSIYKCASLQSWEFPDHFKFNIKELDKDTSPSFEVLFRAEDMSLKCACNRYEQYGLLCRHIFCVLRVCQIKEFPKNYVMKRWTKDAVPNGPIPSTTKDKYTDEVVDEVKGVVREIMMSTDQIVNRLANNMEKLSIFRDQLKEQLHTVEAEGAGSTPTPIRDRIATLLGFKQPEEDVIRRPLGIRTKGCGSKKRFKSIEERITARPAKARRCGVCGKTGHDCRTCSEKSKTTPPGMMFADSTHTVTSNVVPPEANSSGSNGFPSVDVDSMV